MKQFLPYSLAIVALFMAVMSSAQAPMFLVSNSNANLYKADTSSGNISNVGAMSPNTGSMSQCNGLSVHPCNGELFIVANHSSSSDRSLMTVDNNGNAELIGDMGDYVASIAFDSQGTLYAVTGDGASTSETLYTVNQSTGAMTFVQSLGNGSDGEVIAYCPDNGKMYHWSGWESSLSSLTFESIDLNTNAVTNIGMTGTVSPTSIRAAAYVGQGYFLLSHHASGTMALCDTSGVVVASSYSTSISVKGMAIQTPGITSPRDGVCPGESAELTASAGLSYQWYFNGSLISGATSQTYTTSSAGYYNCVIQNSLCTDSTAGGFFLDSFDLPVVNISANDSGFCPGGAVSVTGSQGGQSQWFLNGDSVSGATTNSLLASTEGWYNMVKTNQNGCSDSSSVGVYIEEFEEPDVNLGSDDAICMGDSTVLDAGSFNNATYIWIPFAQGQTYTVTDSGTYISVVTSEQGCTGSDTIHIGYNPDAVVDLGGDTVICDTASILLDAGAGLASYAWSTGESSQTIIVDMNAVPAGDTSVNVLVNVLNSFGCSAVDSVTVSFTDCSDSTIGISPVNSELVNIFPNPTNGNISIQSQTELKSITVIDALGSMIYSDQLTSTRTQLSILTPGFYFINLTDNKGRTYIERVVVQ